MRGYKIALKLSAEEEYIVISRVRFLRRSLVLSRMIDRKVWVDKGMNFQV